MHLAQVQVRAEGAGLKCTERFNMPRPGTQNRSGKRGLDLTDYLGYQTLKVFETFRVFEITDDS